MHLNSSCVERCFGMGVRVCVMCVCGGGGQNRLRQNWKRIFVRAVLN